MNFLELRIFDNITEYRKAVLVVLLEDEVRNNLPISIMMDNKTDGASGRLLAAVIDSKGAVILTAVCIKPFNLLLYETGGIRRDDAVGLLAQELRRSGFTPPGVTAEQDLARRFTGAYLQGGHGKLHMPMYLMRLDKLAEYITAPGSCRMLEERDISYAPYWEHEFCVECRVSELTIKENTDRIRTRIGKDIHFIWEDTVPVSQAVHGRDTPNGAIINWVYTPPRYRGNGYATSVVAALVDSLLNNGKSFCCLFADAENPASRGVYRKLGFYDVCIFEDIRFE